MKPRIGINMDVQVADGRPRMAVPATYVDAVREAGGQPHLVPCVGEKEFLQEHMDSVDGFLFIGGADYPSSLYTEPAHEKTKLMNERRWAADVLLAGLALERDMPVLGICAGHQLLNIACGGKLIQHMARAGDHTDEKYHDVKIVGGRILKRIFGRGPISVNSIHHQAVDPAGVGKDLEVAAVAADGTIEAVESTGDRFLLGVQWHPERIRDAEHRRKIFAAFVEAARKE